MTDDKEDLIYSLLGEFQRSIGAAFNDERKFAFIAGARAALVAQEEALNAAIVLETAKLKAVNDGTASNRIDLQIVHASRLSALEDFQARANG